MFATGAVSSTSPGATTWRAGGLPRRLAAQGLLAGGFSGSDPPSERCCAGQAMRNLLESHIAIHHMACMACNAAPSLPQLRGLTRTRMTLRLPVPQKVARTVRKSFCEWMRQRCISTHHHCNSAAPTPARAAHPCEPPRAAHPCTGQATCIRSGQSRGPRLQLRPDVHRSSSLCQACGF